MPLDKDFKRLVRGRMQKTGESYTAARAVLRKKPALKSRAPSLAEPDYARLAGLSDAAVAAKTGRTWAGWVEALDDAGASQGDTRQVGADHLGRRHLGRGLASRCPTGSSPAGRKVPGAKRTGASGWTPWPDS